MAVEKVTVFQTRDKNVYTTELEANVHETELDLVSIIKELDLIDVRRAETSDLTDVFLRNLVVLGEKAKFILESNKAIKVIAKM